MSAQFNIIIITKGKQRCDTLGVFFHFYHKMLRYAELILTPHCVPRNHQLKIHSHLNLFSLRTAYRVASYLRYTAILNLFSLRTAYRVATNLRYTAILNLFSLRTAYRVASYLRYTAILNLFSLRTAYRVASHFPNTLDVAGYSAVTPIKVSVKLSIIELHVFHL